MKSVLRLVVLAILVAFAAPAGAADKSWPIDRVLGRDDAPITVIEYSSLTCPHCASFFQTNHERIKAELIDTGKIRLIFRDFPLDPAATAAALVAQCADDRYFSFVSAYFGSQANWSRAADPLAAIKGIGRLGGMSEDKLNACLGNRDLLTQINQRKKDASDIYKVDAVPAFVVNGKLKATGGMSYDDFVKLLN